jgi:hypothetical protein
MSLGDAVSQIGMRGDFATDLVIICKHRRRLPGLPLCTYFLHVEENLSGSYRPSSSATSVSWSLVRTPTQAAGE